MDNLELKHRLNLLFVTYCFPPGAEVGGKRPTNFCRYLPDYGIQPTVLTVDPEFYRALDESYVVPRGIRIERTGMLPDPLEWYIGLRRHTGSNPNVPTDQKITEEQQGWNGLRTSFLRRNILPLFGCYRAYLRWYPQAIWASERLIRQESIDAIISTGPPWVVHLVARRLKQKFHLPWAADFRDFWATDVWRSKDLPSWDNTLAQKLEAACITSADLVICNTNNMRHDFIQRYPTLLPMKFVTLTNGYDHTNPSLRSNLKSPCESASGRIVQRLLLHLGDLYSGRRVEGLCQAIRGLISSGSMDQGSIKVVFQGDAEASIVAAAETVTPDLVRRGNIQFRPRVPWENAQQLLANADVLLIIQGDNPAVPAKFYEYLRTGKPIFAVVQQGPLSEIMEETGAGLWADPRDPDGIATKLLNALALPRRSPDEVRKVAGRYHYRALTEQLAQWIWQLASARTGGREPG